MFCPSCGNANAPEMSFCQSCGIRLPTAAPPAPAAPPAGGASFGDALVGFLKVLGSFFALPATSLADTYRELARVGSKKGAFSTKATPTPFLTWVLIAMRMMVPVLAVLWVILFTLLGFLAGGQQSSFFGGFEERHWWQAAGAHLGSGFGALIGSLIGAFFFLWAANFWLDALSVFINLNQKVSDIHKEMVEGQHKGAV